MASVLIETKLHAPGSRSGVVLRPRLMDRLTRAMTSKVTLVSAPPGFGKSTLVADWIAALPPTEPAGWLSLDSGDNDPSEFWRYVIAAVQAAAPDSGRDAAAVLESREPQVERALRSLLNDLASLERDVVLVLDDFHVIELPDIHEAVAYLIDRLPPAAHLVITTRADPPLPFARLRVRGELVEIRAADLRFTPQEAAVYLNGTMGLELTGPDVAALEARTEGWIAALQLAALSMQGRADPASFIASFAGDDRYVFDYLADEVLARQPEDIRSFLIKTSILDRMTASLCDAVTGRSDGRAILERLDRDNLFVVALDDQRRWYRYHHLFGDVLRARLLDEDVESAAGLHRRASDWFAQHGENGEAIRHALDGGDDPRAAELIEQALPDLQAARAETTIRRWLEALPAVEVEVRPVLAAAFAGALMQSGEFARVEALLDTAARALEPARAATTLIANEDGRRRLPGLIGMLRAGHARVNGGLSATIAIARQALEVAEPDDHLTRGGSASLLGLAYWETGDLDAAYRSFADGMTTLERGGFQSDVVGGQVTLADIRIAQGRLGAAQVAYKDGLDIAVGHGGLPLRGAADMHVGLADVLRERNDLVGAREHLAASRELGEENGLPKNPYRSRLAEARIRQAEGDLGAALALLDDAERVFFADFSPVVTPIPAVKARIWIGQGRLSQARAWAETADVDGGGTIGYVDQFDHATLARLLLAEGRIEDALALAERLIAAAQDRGWIGAAIDALIVQALGRHANGDAPGALTSLDGAFSHAEPEGYIRVFADEGRPMAALLTEASKRGIAASYVSLIRAAFTSTGPARRVGLIEPLSERELEVLRLLATDLSGPQIADHLVVSLNTVRSHTKAIFAKLGVTSRRAAVSRASELDLLTHSRS
ncbi:MAG TPA: LuxR C-terminal-related transcriptional regulator [Candidatus Limnocylindrales bacterium]|jgi:LuxR family maltose regulon positive regulatory protein|nr:LuxR C-terminal-related transcriptional regulator [Candidatus Limnocylindrales bacterium]